MPTATMTPPTVSSGAPNPTNVLIENLDRVIQDKEQELTKLRDAREQLAGSSGYVGPPKTNVWMGKGLVWAAHTWLTEVGGGRSTREIADAVRDRGVTSGSRNYIATVYATLTNSKSKFVRKDGLWYAKAYKKG